MPLRDRTEQPDSIFPLRSCEGSPCNSPPPAAKRPRTTRRESEILGAMDGNDMKRRSESVIVQNPEILSGVPVFRGTRVPFQALLDYLEGGDTLDQFLEQFPGVSRANAFASSSAAMAFARLTPGNCSRNWSRVSPPSR